MVSFWSPTQSGHWCKSNSLNRDVPRHSQDAPGLRNQPSGEWWRHFGAVTYTILYLKTILPETFRHKPLHNPWPADHMADHMAGHMAGRPGVVQGFRTSLGTTPKDLGTSPFAQAFAQASGRQF